ncbi:MAG: pseudaminic acid cytidylyltransferase [Pirellulaceae bacterium]
MNIAIIPARGGSKRIPRKNVRPFCGRPMISWSIQAAQACGLFDRVLVSTDCPEIGRVAEDYGASVPFMRPAELSDDHTPTIPVVRHAIDVVLQQGHAIDHVCCVYATAPFIRTSDLLQGHAKLVDDDQLEFVVSVTEFAFPVQRALTAKGNCVEMIWPEHELTRSQDLPPAWHDAGQFYWGRPDAFQRRDGFFNARTAAVILPAHRVVDIDTPDDWTRAEMMFLASRGVSAA